MTPRQFLAIAGDELPARYRRALERYRYGPGVFKVDYALSGPVPWARAGVRAGSDGPPRRHARRDRGRRARRLAGPPSRAAVRPRRAAEPLRPDARARGEAHALGLLPRPERLDADGGNGGGDRGSDRAVRARLPRPRPRGDSVLDPAALEAHNPNYVGGDINGGSADLRQLFTRPVAAADPLPDADRRRLPLLVVDPARRRRPRHVRLPRRARRAPPLVGRRANSHGMRRPQPVTPRRRLPRGCRAPPRGALPRRPPSSRTRSA